MKGQVWARFLALACLALFLGRTFHKSWNISESDFPNYFTGAVLVKHGEPLVKYYDWTWFQRQMNFAGIEKQLGTYIPQTPLAMLPLLPVAGFPVQTARRAWLSFNLGLLVGGVWLLSRVTNFRIEYVVLLLFAGYGTLQSNFFLGQYYVFLFFLLTLTVYCLQHKQSALSGALCGVAFALKLYGAPFLVYFVARRNWKAVAGFVGALVCGIGIAVAMFGWGDVHYYAARILPRALEGEVIDPYNSRNETVATLLRRLFVLEPELNPEPLWNAPATFFFLRPFASALILFVTLVGLAGERPGTERRDFAWFMIAIVLLSANTASYTFILMLLPISLLLVDAKAAERVWLVVAYFALCFPLRPSWSAVFPKLWVLLAVFVVAGWPYLRSARPALVMAAVGVAAVLSGVDARRHILGYAAEPGQRFERMAVRKDAIFSGAPAVSKAGLIYQSIGRDRYVLRWVHNGVDEELVFEGHAFLPVAPSADGPVYFELVSHGRSMTMAFDPGTRRTAPGVPVGSVSQTTDSGANHSVTSWDGRWVALEREQGGPRQIWVRNMASGAERQLTAGNCNSGSPAWELDSRAIVFASDCGRGIGLPALYRAEIAGP